MPVLTDCLYICAQPLQQLLYLLFKVATYRPARRVEAIDDLSINTSSNTDAIQKLIDESKTDSDIEVIMSRSRVRMEGCDMGRGLFTTSDIAASEKLIGFLRPYAAALDINRLADTCYHCMRFDHNHDNEQPEKSALTECPKCKVPRYCSEPCQNLNWKALHRYECEIFTAMPGTLSNGGRALLRMILLRTQPGYSPMWLDLLNLTGDARVVKRKNRKLYQEMAAIAYLVKQYTSTTLEPDALCDLLAKIAVNSFTLNGVFGDPIGIVLQPYIALINHSCQPNAFIRLYHSQFGLLMEVRASKSIPKGEQVFISYVDETNPVYIRQAHLQSMFHFVCRCNRCFLNTESKTTAAECEPTGPPRPIESHAFSLLAGTEKAIPDVATAEELSQTLTTLLETGAYDVHQQPVAALRNTMMHAYATGPAQDRTWLFLQSLVQFVRVDPRLYPYPLHSRRLAHQLHLVKLAQCIEVEGLRGTPAVIAADAARALWQYLLHDLREKTESDEGTWSFAGEVKKCWLLAGIHRLGERDRARMRVRFERVLARFDRICRDSLLRAELEGVSKDLVGIPALEDGPLDSGEDEEDGKEGVDNGGRASRSSSGAWV